MNTQEGSAAMVSNDADIKPNGISSASGIIVEIPLEDLHEFEYHPFQVRNDAAMRETAKSISEHGVLVPGIVRPRDAGGYEIIAGHRRRRGCQLAGKSTMPVIIRNLNDVEATIIMVDSNLQREKLLPSEKAWAYRMKLEALNHRGAQLEGFVSGTLSVDILAKQVRDSKSQIFRFVRLTELVPALLDMVDEGKIAFGPGVELSYLSRKQQAAVLDALAKYEATPSLSQTIYLKKLSRDGLLTSERIDEIMATPKKELVKVTLTGNRLQHFFPDNYTPRQMETIIIKLLENWHHSRMAIT